MRKILKQTYFASTLRMNKSNIKKTWLLLCNFVFQQPFKLYFPIPFTIDNEQISNKLEMAESFNTYFANIGKTTSQNVPWGNTCYTNYLHKIVINGMFNNILITQVQSIHFQLFKYILLITVVVYGSVPYGSFPAC